MHVRNLRSQYFHMAIEPAVCIFIAHENDPYRVHRVSKEEIFQPRPHAQKCFFFIKGRTLVEKVCPAHLNNANFTNFCDQSLFFQSFLSLPIDNSYSYPASACCKQLTQQNQLVFARTLSAFYYAPRVSKWAKPYR